MNKFFTIRKNLTLLYIILLFIIVISIVGEIVLACLSTVKIYLYYNRIVNDDIQHFLYYVITITSGVLFFIICIRKTLRILISAACILIIYVISSFTGGFWEADKTYFEFQSPDGRIIVVEECSWLLGGWSNVYQKADPHTIKGLNGRISTDDGYWPFTHNDYSLEWFEDSVLITYGYGNAGTQAYKSRIYQLE